MSVDIEARADRSICLDEFKELFREGGFDARDCESLTEAADLLLALSNNKSFLSDFIVNELTTDLAGQADNFYGPHVIKLGSPTDSTVMRANIWPAEDDEDYKRSPNAFVYGVPHDHNFNFLTVGYWGPGYKSQYYEYDYENVEGYAGEPSGVRKAAFKSLEPDSVMLYRAHHDIHSQFPPDKMSISINIMDASPTHHYRDQYIFSSTAADVAVVLSSRCSPTLFEVAASFGDDRIQDALVFISRNHQSDYARACALRSAIKAEKDLSRREKLISYGRESPTGSLREVVNRYSARAQAVVGGV